AGWERRFREKFLEGMRKDGGVFDFVAALVARQANVEPKSLRVVLDDERDVAPGQEVEFRQRLAPGGYSFFLASLDEPAPLAFSLAVGRDVLDRVAATESWFGEGSVTLRAPGV